MRHTTRTTVTLCAALGLTAAVGSAAATPSAPPPAARAASVRQATAPVLVDCFQHARVRPGSFLLACGDGNSRLVSLHWRSWGSGSARATGVNVVNDCDPYCAAGTFHRYAVRVKLDRPQPWKKNPRVQHYSRITLTYPGDRPDQFGRVVTYPLWN
ncbi:hypothetical protein PYK79_56655 [Streptomyces sp. ID05-04B]|uniref:hypothetical protein n=1 Tax=unclassified Streptomyces TaxID=2593676 RepID=UPI000D1BF3EE|nr:MULTISPECIES: hypothetical protein [unclassified Streptomyces]AVV46976.1 hypothetical protein C6376_42285 [Streptomyces sp. P3]MDX5570860.1 hypothetical protein [Streptomyces sp. ID05-04B]